MRVDTKSAQIKKGRTNASLQTIYFARRKCVQSELSNVQAVFFKEAYSLLNCFCKLLSNVLTYRF